MHRSLLIVALCAAGVAEAQPREPDLRPGRAPRPREGVIQLAGEVPLAAIEALARQHLPAKKRWRAPPYTHAINGGAGSVDGASIGYDIISGAASVRAGAGGEIVTSVPLTYSIWARYQPVAGGPSFDASCLRRSASLVLTTTLSIRGSKLVPRTRASVAARSRCVITRLQIDVTDLLAQLVGRQLRRVTAEIDRKVAGAVDIGAAAALAWRRLATPRTIDGGWLDIGPVALQVPPIAIANGRLVATLQVISKSTLVFGGSKPAARRAGTPAPMPAIDSHSSPPSLSVVVAVAVAHRALDRWATRAARSIRLPRRITGVALRPRGRMIAVGIDLASIGRVWMTGELGVEPSSGAVTIAALRLAPAARSRLARSPVKPARLVAAVRKALATIDVDALDDLRARTQDALTSSLGSAVPLLSGAAAIERIKLASVVRDKSESRFYFRAEGTSVAGATCSIRARGKITRREMPCTRKSVRAHCRRCEYSTDGKTWLPVR